MWGGAGRSAGAQPKLAYLIDAIAQLRASGFQQVGVFVDAATWHDLSAEDARQLERMKARTR